MSGCECKPDAKRKRDSAQPQEKGAAIKKGTQHATDQYEIRGRFLFAGAIVGAAIALLYAPQTGVRIEVERAQIARQEPPSVIGSVVLFVVMHVLPDQAQEDSL